MSVTDYTIKHFVIHSLVGNIPESRSIFPQFSLKILLPDALKPLRNWLNKKEIHDPQVAHRVCRLIPSQCPFARDIKLFGRVIVSIPPLCKLNPLYEELMTLRFRALCYLADEWGEDISQYC